MEAKSDVLRSSCSAVGNYCIAYKSKKHLRDKSARRKCQHCPCRVAKYPYYYDELRRGKK